MLLPHLWTNRSFSDGKEFYIQPVGVASLDFETIKDVFEIGNGPWLIGDDVESSVVPVSAEVYTQTRVRKT